MEERVFTRLFEQAEIAKFSDTDLKAYEDSMNAYRDIVNAINTARKDSFAEGKAEGLTEGMEKGLTEGMERRNVEIARMMLAAGEPIEKIIRYTNLPKNVIEKQAAHGLQSYSACGTRAQKPE